MFKLKTKLKMLIEEVHLVLPMEFIIFKALQEF